MGTERRPSPESGGSEGTTDNVFRQFGHMKQFLAHLVHGCERNLWDASIHRPIFFCAYTCTWDLEETVWAVVCTDFDRDTSVTADGVAFFTEKEGVERVKAVGR